MRLPVMSISCSTCRSLDTITSDSNVAAGVTVIALLSVVSIIGVNKEVVTVRLFPIVTSLGSPTVTAAVSLPLPLTSISFAVPATVAT